MIKAKFGDAVRSKSDIGQMNEVRCKVLCRTFRTPLEPLDSILVIF